MGNNQQSAYALYNKKKGNKLKLLVFLTIILIFISFLSIVTGSYQLSIQQTLAAIFKKSTNPNHILLIWQMRLPRTILAIIAGACLSVSGAIMQTCLKNDLASPSTLGITSGATFGANLSIIIFGSSLFSISLLEHFPYLTSLFAFLFSIIVVLIILALSKIKSFTPQTIILAGIAMNSLFQAFTTLIQYFADQVTLSQAIFWTFGDLTRGGWTEILILLIVTVPIVLYFLTKSWDYNSLATHEDFAKSVGVSVNKTRFISILLAALITSTCVSFLGMISFIGLLGPHIAKKLIGKNHQLLIPGSIIIGAIILTSADIISRSIVQPIVLPVGAITSLIGAFLFLYILIKGGKKSCT